jgi:biotin transport system permease protein
MLFVFLARVLKMRPVELVRGSKALFIMCVPVVIMGAFSFFPFSFSLSGLIDALFFLLTILFSFAAGAVYFSCTKMNDLKEALPPLLGLSISLTLHFIPRFFEIWEDTQSAWLSRGGKKNIASFFILLPPIVERMIESAAETALALRARQY